MNHKFKVDYQKCIKCGQCIENCPTKALEYDDYKSPKMEKPKNCMKCQHCFAICPVGAISGEIRQPFHIDPEKCIKCGACYNTCRFGAISK